MCAVATCCWSTARLVLRPACAGGPALSLHMSLHKQPRDRREGAHCTLGLEFWQVAHLLQPLPTSGDKQVAVVRRISVSPWKTPRIVIMPRIAQQNQGVSLAPARIESL